jgi:hypothetical protein
MNVVKRSTLTCPECGHSREEQMPEDSCLFFYRCTACDTILKPQPEDCCVFCSYGTVKCPPIQQQGRYPDGSADEEAGSEGCRC